MQKRNVIVLVAAALIVALVSGSIGIAAAASSGSDSAANSNASSGSFRPNGTSSPGLRGGGPGHGGPGRGGANLVRVVAKLTDETTATVIASRETTGSSFASIAKKKNVTVAEIVKLAMAAPTAAVESQLSNGLLTKSEASDMLSHLKDSVTREVNSTRPFHARGGPKGPHGAPGDCTPPGAEAPAGGADS